MHRGIIEFDPLSDPNGTRADNDNAFSFGTLDEGFRLVMFLVVVGRIEVRRLRRKLRRAGIDHFEYGAPVRRKLFPAERFQILICVSELFARKIIRLVQFLPLDFLFVTYQIKQLIQEPSVYFCNIENFVRRRARF